MKIVKFALLIGCVSMLMTSSATFAQTRQTRGTAGHTDSAAMLRQDMRKVWTDHVVWTRDFIIAATEKQPGAPAALNRLMKNQEEIGTAVAKYYGDAAGQKLTTLLKDHIAIAGDIVKAAMAGDKSGQATADDFWHQNATQIAEFLSRANLYWPRATLLDMMNTHLSTTSTELAARLNNDWDGDVKAYDAVYDHILHMADALSEGIVKQFPDKFGKGAVSTTGR